MARVVEAAVQMFEDRVRVDTVITKTRDGARRYLEIVGNLRRPVAVPSILINGSPVFEVIPGVEELQHSLQQMVEKDE